MNKHLLFLTGLLLGIQWSALPQAHASSPLHAVISSAPIAQSDGTGETVIEPAVEAPAVEAPAAPTLGGLAHSYSELVKKVADERKAFNDLKAQVTIQQTSISVLAAGVQKSAKRLELAELNVQLADQELKVRKAVRDRIECYQKMLALDADFAVRFARAFVRVSPGNGSPTVAATTTDGGAAVATVGPKPDQEVKAAGAPASRSESTRIEYQWQWVQDGRRRAYLTPVLMQVSSSPSGGSVGAGDSPTGGALGAAILTNVVSSFVADLLGPTLNRFNIPQRPDLGSFGTPICTLCQSVCGTTSTTPAASAIAPVDATTNDRLRDETRGRLSALRSGMTELRIKLGMPEPLPISPAPQLQLPAQGVTPGSPLPFDLAVVSANPLEKAEADLDLTLFYSELNALKGEQFTEGRKTIAKAFEVNHANITGNINDDFLERPALAARNVAAGQPEFTRLADRFGNGNGTTIFGQGPNRFSPSVIKPIRQYISSNIHQKLLAP